jgi:hypothetical protein
MSVSSVITTKGMSCKFCNKRVGKEIHALFVVPVWNNPKRSVNLCEKDLKRFEDYQEAERQHFLSLYSDPIDRELLDKESRALYEELIRN